MTATVSLRAIVDELDLAVGGTQVFLNRDTAELVPLKRHELEAAEQGADPQTLPAWLVEVLRPAQLVLSGGSYVALPDRLEVDESAMMTRFARTRERPEHRAGLLEAAGSPHEFWRAVRRLAIAGEWCRYREAVLEEIAIAWLRENRISYEGE